MRLTPAQNKLKKAGQSELQYEEYILSIVSALLRHAPASCQERILGKFVETDFAKVRHYA